MDRLLAFQRFPANSFHDWSLSVCQVVFGRDMDSSIERTAEHLDDDTFHGAAGRRSLVIVGHTP